MQSEHTYGMRLVKKNAVTKCPNEAKQAHGLGSDKLELGYFK